MKNNDQKSLVGMVARLTRAGSENSQQTIKLRKAADELLIWIANNIPKNVRLPMNCTFYLEQGRFVQDSAPENSPGGRSRVLFDITIGNTHTLEQLASFSKLIANGFLEQLSEVFEASSATQCKCCELIAAFTREVRPITLTTGNYHKEIYSLSHKGVRLSDQLACCLDCIVDSHIRGLPLVKTTPELVLEAKDCLSGDIIISGSSLDISNPDHIYNLAIISSENNTDQSHFILMKKYQGMKVTYLRQMHNQG